MMAERMWGDGLRLGAGDDVPVAGIALNSRRWRHGQRNGIRCAANDMEFENRKCYEM